MKRVTGSLCAVLLALGTVLPTTVAARSNYKIKGEVHTQTGGYRHVVIVKNKTRDWLNCNVWTDVDPQPTHSVRVGPRSKREVVVRTRAEQDEFIPYGYCRSN